MCGSATVSSSLCQGWCSKPHLCTPRLQHRWTPFQTWGALERNSFGSKLVDSFQLRWSKDKCGYNRLLVSLRDWAPACCGAHLEPCPWCSTAKGSLCACNYQFLSLHHPGNAAPGSALKVKWKNGSDKVTLGTNIDFGYRTKWKKALCDPILSVCISWSENFPLNYDSFLCNDNPFVEYQYAIRGVCCRAVLVFQQNMKFQKHSHESVKLY